MPGTLMAEEGELERRERGPQWPWPGGGGKAPGREGLPLAAGAKLRPGGAREREPGGEPGGRVSQCGPHRVFDETCVCVCRRSVLSSQMKMIGVGTYSLPRAYKHLKVNYGMLSPLRLGAATVISHERGGEKALRLRSGLL